MRFIQLSLLAAAIMGASLPAWADPASTPNIDQRQIEQQQRINQGVQSGSLTPAEAARLQRGQEHVQAVETRAKADGVVTPQERRRITEVQNVENRRIARQKHDRQHR